VIPALFHPILDVLLFHLLAAFTMGMTLSPIFQLAHCVDAAEFPAPPEGAPEGPRLMHDDWAAHQVETTVDFGQTPGVITWFLGGLNFQVEHHLFPKVCHLHYPALSRLVRETAEKHGIRCRSHLTLSRALVSHYRHLTRLGSSSGGDEAS
jgi:linoleoyl-CoA desaturase